MVNRLLTIWETAAKDLGLEITAPFHLTLPSGTQVEALFLVKNFGADNGMLVLMDFNEVKSCINEIISEGFGFSILDEPVENELYSRQDFIELLEDWSWSGAEKNKPMWLTSNQVL